MEKNKTHPLKGRKKPQYSDDIKIEAATLWALGNSGPQIAEILGVKDERVIHRWKEQKIPMDWDVLKERTRANKVEKMMRSLPLISASQDELLENVSISLASQIVRKANDKQVDDKVAADLFMNSLNEQRKIRLPLDKQFEKPGLSVGLGAKTNMKTGESTMMMLLNQRYEQLNADDAEDRDLT